MSENLALRASISFRIRFARFRLVSAVNIRSVKSNTSFGRAARPKRQSCSFWYFTQYVQQTFGNTPAKVSLLRCQSLPVSGVRTTFPKGDLLFRFFGYGLAADGENG